MDTPWGELHPLVAGLVVLAIFSAISFAVRRGLIRALRRQDSDREVGQQVARFVSAVVFVLGLAVALNIAEVKVTPLLGALGLGGVAVAFAAQDIIANLLAGILISLRRPFRIGDQITSLGYEGTVRDIDFRAVHVHTYDGLDVILPNAEVLRAPIMNHTRTPIRRTTLHVRVRHSEDLERVREVILDAAREVQGIASNRLPQAWVEEFGDSWIVVAIHFWHASDMATVWRVRNNMAIAVKAALDAAGVLLPYPRHTLYSASEMDGEG